MRLVLADNHVVNVRVGEARLFFLAGNPLHSSPLHSFGHGGSFSSFSIVALYRSAFLVFLESPVASWFILSTSCAYSCNLSCAILVVFSYAILASLTSACASCKGVCPWLC
jgi:hypothetical protein